MLSFLFSSGLHITQKHTHTHQSLSAFQSRGLEFLIKSNNRGKFACNNKTKRNTTKTALPQPERQFVKKYTKLKGKPETMSNTLVLIQKKHTYKKHR